MSELRDLVAEDRRRAMFAEALRLAVHDPRRGIRVYDIDGRRVDRTATLTVRLDSPREATGLEDGDRIIYGAPVTRRYDQLWHIHPDPTRRLFGSIRSRGHDRPDDAKRLSTATTKGTDDGSRNPR